MPFEEDMTLLATFVAHGAAAKSGSSVLSLRQETVDKDKDWREAGPLTGTKTTVSQIKG